MVPARRERAHTRPAPGNTFHRISVGGRVKRIGILIASARPQRVGEHVARWIEQHVDTAAWTVDLIDLGRIALPAFDEQFSPKQGEPYAREHSLAWSARIEALDALVVVTPEYNGSIPGSLKTAVDFLHREWQHLPVLVVGYGWGAGAGAIAESERLFGFVGADVVGSVGLAFRADLQADGTIDAREQILRALDEGLTALEHRAAA